MQFFHNNNITKGLENLQIACQMQSSRINEILDKKIAISEFLKDINDKELLTINDPVIQTLKKYRLNVNDFLNSSNDLILCLGLLSTKSNVFEE